MSSNRFVDHLKPPSSPSDNGCAHAGFTLPTYISCFQRGTQTKYTITMAIMLTDIASIPNRRRFGMDNMRSAPESALISKIGRSDIFYHLPHDPSVRALVEIRKLAGQTAEIERRFANPGFTVKQTHISGQVAYGSIRFRVLRDGTLVEPWHVPEYPHCVCRCPDGFGPGSTHSGISPRGGHRMHGITWGRC